MSRGRGTGRDGRRPPDLRLAGLAVCTWLGAYAALHLSIRTVLAVCVPAAALAAVLVCAGPGRAARANRARATRACVTGRPPPGALARLVRATGRVPGRRWTAATLLLGIVLGGGTTAAHLARRDAAPVPRLAAAHVSVSTDLVVRDDPRPIGRPGRLSYLLSADLVRLRPEAGAVTVLSTRILVIADDRHWSELLPGQRLSAEGKLQPARGGDLRAAVLITDGPPRLLGPAPWLQRAAGSLRAGLRRACAPLPPRPGGLLPGLVVGDTSHLDPAVAADFRATGMTHLVAVSGSNVAVVVGAVLLLITWVRCPPWLAALVCVLALAGFVVLVRPSPSVLRAAAMGAIGLAGLASGRPRAAVPALCATVIVLVVIDPGLAVDAGFALSVLATAGLLLLAPPWRDALRRKGVPAGVAEALAVPAAAQTACAPVVAALSASVSLVAVPANLLAAPATAPATVLGVAAAVLSVLWPPAGAFAAWVACWPAWWLVLVAHHGAQVPAGSLPWPGGTPGGLLLAALTVVLLVAGRRRLTRRLIAVVALAAVVGALPVRLLAGGWPPPGWLIAACDVGQGDALVLSVATRQAVVIDAGPEPDAVDGCLRRLGVRRVPLLLLSHFHADHVGGVGGVLRGRTVGEIVTPRWPEPTAGVDLVGTVAAGAGVPVRVAGAGRAFSVGAAELVVLAPRHALSGTRSDPNNNSLVVRARVRGVTILLPGDAEGEEQQTLLDQLGADALRADVLKVAHHGSAYQSPRLLATVRPAVALVSVGVDNDYGHPSTAVLNQLARSGARVLRTDRSGDLAVVLAGGSLAVSTRGVGPRPP